MPAKRERFGAYAARSMEDLGAYLAAVQFEGCGGFSIAEPTEVSSGRSVVPAVV